MGGLLGKAINSVGSSIKETIDEKKRRRSLISEAKFQKELSDIKKGKIKPVDDKGKNLFGF